MFSLVFFISDLKSNFRKTIGAETLGVPLFARRALEKPVHDSNRLHDYTPRSPFRHLKQQRQHHSMRPSYQATQHAQKQATQQTTEQTHRPHSRQPLVDSGLRITSLSVFFSKFAYPHHSVYFYFTACRVHKELFP